MTASNFSEIINELVRPRKNHLSTEDLEIKQQEDRRKELRKKENRSERERK